MGRSVLSCLSALTITASTTLGILGSASQAQAALPMGKMQQVQKLFEEAMALADDPEKAEGVWTRAIAAPHDRRGVPQQGSHATCARRRGGGDGRLDGSGQPGT